MRKESEEYLAMQVKYNKAQTKFNELKPLLKLARDKFFKAVKLTKAAAKTTAKKTK